MILWALYQMHTSDKSKRFIIFHVVWQVIVLLFVWKKTKTKTCLMYHFYGNPCNFCDHVFLSYYSWMFEHLFISLVPLPLTFLFFLLSLSSSYRTVTSRRKSTMRSGCAMAPASCWLPAPRKTRHWRRQRVSRPAALASWPTCRSCRGWRRLKLCRRSRGGRRTRGRWTIVSPAKEKWPSQASWNVEEYIRLSLCVVEIFALMNRSEQETFFCRVQKSWK